ncbi:GNAT family N-acetyltransferase [Bosea sp. (in: a-proteobacteria)]|jgi:putative acetyltransferase|uniref:GNAT family N-acetyltransferase n=1 Tax=Bosea sp. (in: a-proteobacteria) TaxID=1871050 RepID=UPI0027342CC1|nr:GNAT family N-acetyltransferase [Bosea sp. (in: a-proteobacteria)]MDP3408874.1 GNAT family N-acetyltransferase [Bosea sp. (in: a-proteobacteria)]
MNTAHPEIRPARDDDSEPLARLIAACFAEYPNCAFVWDEFPELRAPASHFAAKGGRLWIVDGPDGGIAGSLAATPLPEQNAVEITKVYAAPAFRGSGLAQALFAEALAFAQAGGHSEMMLWSDTRFARGHRFYEKLGFRRWPGERYLADVSATWEYHFRLSLAGQPVSPAPR